MKQRSKQPLAMRIIPALVAAAMTSGISSAAYAQAKPSENSLEEVIVTAQKVKERLQNVAISIQAFNTAALEAAGVTSLRDMRALAPSVEFKTYPIGNEDLLVTTRGVATAASSLFIDQATAVHIDGVYIARPAGLNLTVADLESVEVLKGPQGTLYGRNTIAGAINLNTARPSQDFGFNQTFTIGNFGREVSKTVLNVPITDTFAAKLAYVHDQGDGYVKDSLGSGRNWGDRKSDSGRLDFRWTPTNKVTVDYGYDWNDVNYIMTPNQCITQDNYLPGQPLKLSAATYPAALCSTDRLDALPMPNGPYTFANDPWNQVKNSGHTLKIDWQLNDDTTLRSITGYRSLRDNRTWNSVTGTLSTMAEVALNYPGTVYVPFSPTTLGSISTAGLVYPVRRHITSDDYYSQEFNLIGKLSETLRYTAGVYFYSEKGDFHETAGSQLIDDMTPVFGGLPVYLNSIAGPITGAAKNSSTAVFGQFTWTPDILSRRLDVTPGIRFTRDTREASRYAGGSDTYFVTPFGLPAGVPYALTAGYLSPTLAMGPGMLYLPATAPVMGTAGGIPAAGKHSFSNTSPALTLQYHIDKDVMGYGKLVKGYRAGGFNERASSNAMFNQGFSPETLTTAELGLKGEFLDRRLRANAAVFQSKYKDQQLFVPGTVISISDIINAGKSTYNGFELDLSAKVTDKLRLGFSYSYVDFKYDSVLTSAGVDVTRFYHLQPAKNNYGATLDYIFGNIGPAKAKFHLDYSSIDKAATSYIDNFAVAGGVATLVQAASPTNTTTPAYSLWNTRLSFDSIRVGPDTHGDISVGLWIKNLTDKKYTSFNIDYSQYSFVGNVSPWGAPRTYGIDVTYRY